MNPVINIIIGEAEVIVKASGAMLMHRLNFTYYFYSIAQCVCVCVSALNC